MNGRSACYQGHFQDSLHNLHVSISSDCGKSDGDSPVALKVVLSDNINGNYLFSEKLKAELKMGSTFFPGLSRIQWSSRST